MEPFLSLKAFESMDVINHGSHGISVVLCLSLTIIHGCLLLNIDLLSSVMKYLLFAGLLSTVVRRRVWKVRFLNFLMIARAEVRDPFLNQKGVKLKA